MILWWGLTYTVRRTICWTPTRRPRRSATTTTSIWRRARPIRSGCVTRWRRCTSGGLKPYIVLAIHEATGAVAGLTEVVVPAQHPERADQYDTIVVREHRGFGIDRAIKARMLFELRAAEPTLRQVQTWNAQHDESMLKLNAELGYQPTAYRRKLSGSRTTTGHNGPTPGSPAMSIIADLVHGGAAATAAAGVLYTATVTISALTALIAPTPQRRRDARTVLNILLRRPTRR